MVEVAVAKEFDLTADKIDAALRYYESNPDEMEALAAEAEATHDRLNT